MLGTNLMENSKMQMELQELFAQHGITSVAMSEGSMGCPHEEGEDCPFCPFWKGKQGSNRKE